MHGETINRPAIPFDNDCVCTLTSTQNDCMHEEAYVLAIKTSCVINKQKRIRGLKALAVHNGWT